jgi:hypothetical protein
VVNGDGLKRTHLRTMFHVPGRDHDWPHVPRASAQPVERVPLVLRSPPKAQSGEVPTLSEGSTIPQAYCVPCGDNHWPKNLKVVGECTTPKNKHKTRSFLGLCNYCRGFIYLSITNIAKLLTKYTEEKEPLQWTPELEAAFQSLKKAFCTAPILAYP